VRKLLFVLSFWLSLVLGAAAAETLTLVDGAALSGDIVKFDDNGLLLRVSGEVYTNIPWGKLSQASLKQLTANPKLKPLVEVFIEPDASQRPEPAVIKINPVTRLSIPEHPSLLGGLVGSPVGLVILLVLYLANLFAAFEVAVFRGRPLGQVIGLAALLPIIGPCIFLAMPVKMDKPAEAATGDGVTPGAPVKTEDDIQIVDASWKNEEKKEAKPQVFARGKYTFNKRFLETKFAGFIGELKGEGKTYTMEVRTAKQLLSIERIQQITANEVIFETVQSGQVVVPFGDLQEITLNPKKAE